MSRSNGRCSCYGPKLWTTPRQVVVTRRCWSVLLWLPALSSGLHRASDWLLRGSA